MDFSIALQALKAGHKVRRPTWSGYCVALLNGSLLYGSDSSEPSTFWFPAQGDLLAEDWEVVE
jgi:hypothetical protein